METLSRFVVCGFPCGKPFPGCSGRGVCFYANGHGRTRERGTGEKSSFAAFRSHGFRSNSHG